MGCDIELIETITLAHQLVRAMDERNCVMFSMVTTTRLIITVNFHWQGIDTVESDMSWSQEPTETAA